MAGQIPNLTFRIEPGYSFDQGLNAPEFASENMLIASSRAGGELQAVFLGKAAEYQLMRRNAWLDCEGAHAVYVIGKRRSGKTYTLGIIAEGLSSDAWLRQGNRKQAILLIDSMNVFITMPHLVEETYGSSSLQAQELRKWAVPKEILEMTLLYPRGSPFPPEGRSKEISIRPADLSAEDWATLFEVDTYSDPMGQLIAELYEKVAVEGYTNSSGATVQSNSSYSIQDLLTCLDQCPDVARYDSRTIEGIRRRLRAVARLPIFSPSGIDVADLFAPGCVSVLLLRDIDQVLRSLLVAVIVKRIMQLRSSSDRNERLAAVHKARYETLKDQDEEKATEAFIKYEQYQKEAAAGIPRGWIIIDEAHNYMPARGKMPSSDPLKKYVNEGRNLGLSIVVATQNPSGLDTAIRRNADVLIIHSMSMKDDITSFLPPHLQVHTSG
ncbi:DUF87 domain-containing protein [Dehalococcoidia bacterium]|nr:DUF87 domain-containing protein [Dehalococcoidia bacterium]